MSDDLIVAALIIGIGAVSFVVELWLGLVRHDTISATIFRWYRRYPPTGALGGLVIGILFAHFFFPAGCL